MDIIRQRLTAFFSFLVADRSGLMRYLINNIKNAAFPMITTYVVLSFLALRGVDRAGYMLFVFQGSIYLLFCISPAERVALWYRAEQQRGTMETITLSGLGIAGTLRYMFGLHLLIYLLTEMPFFWLATWLAWGMLPPPEAAGGLLLMAALTVLISYGIAQLLVAMTLLLEASVVDFSLRKFTFNILCGVFCPVTIFPDWLRPVSYALPFTHGIALLRRLLEQEATLSSMDYLPLAAFALGLPVAGKVSMILVERFLRRRRSLTRY